jgi:hypothetical protein
MLSDKTSCAASTLIGILDMVISAFGERNLFSVHIWNTKRCFLAAELLTSIFTASRSSRGIGLLRNQPVAPAPSFVSVLINCYIATLLN